MYTPHIKEQIQSFFSRLFSAYKKGKQPDKKGNVPNSRSDEIFDAERDLRHEEEVHVRYDLSSRAQKDNSDLLHPINVNNADLCELEQSISTTSKLTDSKLEGYPTELLKIIVVPIGKEFSGRRASRKKAADIIVSYVRDSHQNMDEKGGHCPHYELRITA